MRFLLGMRKLCSVFNKCPCLLVILLLLLLLLLLILWERAQLQTDLLLKQPSLPVRVCGPPPRAVVATAVSRQRRFVAC